jgi:hypothetical protein
MGINFNIAWGERGGAYKLQQAGLGDASGRRKKSDGVSRQHQKFIYYQ